MRTGKRQEAPGNSLKARVFGFALCAVLFAVGSFAEAQQPAKVAKIGVLQFRSASDASPGREALRREFRTLGYDEGKNILVEYRYAEGMVDRIPSIVAELVQLKVDVIVAGPLPAIRAAKQATKTIPIVMVTTQDPVATGLVDSLARPGGNITGLTRLTQELRGKRLELLKEVVPEISRVGVLVETNMTTPAFKEYEATARALKVQLQSLEVRGPQPDFEGAFQAAAKARVSALITVNTSLLNRHPKRITDLAWIIHG